MMQQVIAAKAAKSGGVPSKLSRQFKTVIILEIHETFMFRGFQLTCAQVAYAVNASDARKGGCAKNVRLQ